jgi:hypothetical protein
MSASHAGSALALRREGGVLDAMPGGHDLTKHTRRPGAWLDVDQ